MTKIPVTRTVGFAYRFTFGQFGTIIGLIWLPVLLTTLLGYFVMRGYAVTFAQAVAEDNPGAAGQAGLLLIGYSVLALFFYSMIHVAVSRQALGLREGGAVVHVELGLAVWRMFGALLALTIVLVFFYLLLLLAGLGIIAASQSMGSARQPVAIFGLAVFIIGLCAFLFVTVRMAFLLAPVMVAEERLSLSRGWELTRGNFWRILMVLLATLLPLFLIFGAAEFLIFGPQYFVANAHPTLAQKVAHLQQMNKGLPLLYGLSFVMSPFFSGLGLGASAYAYRALMGDAEHA